MPMMHFAIFHIWVCGHAAVFAGLQSFMASHLCFEVVGFGWERLNMAALKQALAMKYNVTLKDEGQSRLPVEWNSVPTP